MQSWHITMNLGNSQGWRVAAEEWAAKNCKVMWSHRAVT